LSLEELESRLVPTVYNVNTLADISIAAGVNPANGRIHGHGNMVTLRSAIEAANETAGNNTIRLLIPGVYRIAIPPASPDDTPATENNQTGDFDIIPNTPNKSGSGLTIANFSGGGRVVIDGNHLDRIFDINPDNATAAAGFTVVLKGLTLQHGFASPGDTGAGTGGAIRDEGNANLTLINVTVRNNRATADGGGIVMENTANSSWTLTIRNSNILHNHSGDAGGGIDTDGAGTVLISNSVIDGNTDINQGAGIYIDSIAVGSVQVAASMTMVQTTVSRNQALANGVTASGGGISNAGNGVIAIFNSTVASNFSGGMGGGFSDENNQGTLIVGGSLFDNNSAIGNGGGIQEGGPSTRIVDSEIVDNSSGGLGGGIFANGTTLAILRATIANNTSVSSGGGIELQTSGSGTHGSTITDATIAYNSALNNAGGNNGGGIDAGAQFTGSVTLLNDTINGNYADVGGGVFWGAATGSVFALQNTIIAQNIAQTGPDADGTGFADNGGNLIGVSGAGSGNTGFTNPTTQTGTVAAPLDPRLGPLTDNGGPKVGAADSAITIETEELLSGSPAIDKGVVNGAPATDERGFPSVTHGHVNVGAVSQREHR
jgi:hypothetical protein